MLNQHVSLVEQENSIFRDYERLYFHKHQVIRDGALGLGTNSYPQEPFRVLFVLREGNDPEEAWKLADIRHEGEGSCHGRRATWPNIARWTALATSPEFSLPFPDANVERKVRRVEVLRRTAVVNLKKYGGGSTANNQVIAGEVQRKFELLKRQLALYKPHVTIAGSDFVAETLAELYQIPLPLPRLPAKHGLAHFSCDALGHVIASWHPGARAKSTVMYEALQDSLQYLFLSAERRSSHTP